MYADIPDSSGTSFVMGQGVFAYPPDESFDRISTMITTGPIKMDSCMKIVSSRVEPSSVEYIDVGDAIVLQNEDFCILTSRTQNLSTSSRKSWFVGYGYELLPFWKITHTNLIHGAKSLKMFNCLLWVACPRKKLLWALFHFPLKVRFNFPNPYKM